MLKYLPNVDLNFNMRMILILIAASSQLLLAGQAQPVNDGSPKKILAPISGLHREPRDVRKLSLKDPLDCLSQLVCGMNTYPPQKPSVRTNTANDFAYLLKAAVRKLRGPTSTPSTSTTAAPPTTKKSTTKAPTKDTEDDDDDDDEEDDTENELDYEADDAEDYSEERRSKERRHQRASIFSKRKGSSNKKKNKKNRPFPIWNPRPLTPAEKEAIMIHKFVKHYNKPLTSLEKLKMETDLRAKLLSDAQCVNGLQDHSCPFNYQQMLSLISSSLERERTISYTSSKVLPMVGYLIKSRNYTGTLEATFLAIERINNYTIEADKEGKPVDFSHILDEVMNRNTGVSGLHIVDTSNESASSSVWEDDEFEHVLQNPYVRRKLQSENYKLAKKKQAQKVSSSTAKPDREADDESTTSEEDTSEEGLIFDRPRPPSIHDGPPDGGDSSSEEDDQNQQDSNAGVFGDSKNKFMVGNKGSLKPPPVFGHLQKSAEDE